MSENAHGSTRITRESASLKAGCNGPSRRGFQGGPRQGPSSPTLGGGGALRRNKAACSARGIFHAHAAALSDTREKRVMSASTFLRDNLFFYYYSETRENVKPHDKRNPSGPRRGAAQNRIFPAWLRGPAVTRAPTRAALVSAE